MEEKKINTIYNTYNSLVNLLHNILTESNLTKDDLFNSLIGIVAVDLIFNKEDMVENTQGIKYKSKMSDNQLEHMLDYIDIENIDKTNNGASIYATIRNKLAHGDYYLDSSNIVFNVNDKECKVSIKDFINYYLKLTVNLNYRYKDKKYVKEQLINKSGGKFNKLLTSRDDIIDYLKFLTYKEYIFRRCDGKELSTYEKEFFSQMIKNICEKDNVKEKEIYSELLKVFDPSIYCIDIINHKIKKLKEDRLLEVEKIIKKANMFYDNDVEFIENILFESAENIYKLASDDYESYALKFGLASLKFMLNDMLNRNIFDVEEYILEKKKEDIYFPLSFPRNEIVIGLIIALIYFNYCFPLEKLYRDNKLYSSNNQNNFDFSNLNLEELNPEINNLFIEGKNNFINQSNIKLASFSKKYIDVNKELDSIISQKMNLLKKYKDTGNNEFLKKVNELTLKINSLDKESSKVLYSLINEQERNIELNNMDNNEFYNYSVIMGIRNAISHGKVKCKCIASEDLKDIEIEFIDYFDDKIQFKLNIKVYNLFSLIEKENLSYTNMHLKKKLNKKD